ncbi:MAG: thiol:disulfide interchange protein [Chitinophagaceae bacterium]|nr:thiol:disulfide interchange protein [Chitinophagaceae bacterium]
MKFSFFSFFFFLITIVNAQNGFTVTGNMKGIKDNSKVFLVSVDGNDTLAKGTVKNGSFNLKGKTDIADSHFLVFTEPDTKWVVFSGNENVIINGDVSKPGSVQVTGSASHRDYEEFMYYVKPLNDYVNYFRNQLGIATRQSQKDSLGIILNTTYNIYQQAVDQFVARKGSSPVSPLLLQFWYETDPDKDAILLEKRLSFLNGEATKTKYFLALQQLVAADKLGSVGSTAVDFTQNDQNGKPVKLSQFKGKYVLVDFWASWCGPCRLENPNVVKAYNQYKDKNFTILSVSLDQDKSNWLKAINDDKLNWNHVSDLQYWNNAVARTYNIQSIPQNFLIDPNGVIIAKNLRGEDLAKKLKELIK